MNIFILDLNPVKAASLHCDKHVVKMTLETAQLLCSAYPEGTAPYKRTHYNHPCAVWARQSTANYRYLVDLGLALCTEYTYRYSKRHKSQDVIEQCAKKFPDIPKGDRTPYAQAMPDEYRDEDVVKAYRKYYKHKFDNGLDMHYTNRRKPDWLGETYV